MEIMEYYFDNLIFNNLFFIFAMYFEPIKGTQPSEDTTVVKQYGLSSQNKR
jgi:hypothetical protein